MATANVEFYEKLKHLQEQKRESERRRLLLEQQLSINASSENKGHALRVAQLQNYWKKLCEDEKRSQRRNEQLLRDLDRISEQAARFAERTEKLRNMKCEYEAYIEKTYPNWKEKVMCRRQQRMCAISNEQQIYSGPRVAQNEQEVHFGDGFDYHQQHPKSSESHQNNEQTGANRNLLRSESIQLKADEHRASAAEDHRKVSIESPAIGYDAKDIADQIRSESIQRSADEHRTSTADSHRKFSVESPAIGYDATDLADQLRSESIHRSANEHRVSATDNRTRVSVESPSNGHAARDPATSSHGASEDPNITPVRDLTSKDPASNPAKSLASKDRASTNPTESPTTNLSSNNPARSSTRNLALDSPISLSPVSSPERQNAKEPSTSVKAKDVMASQWNKKTDGVKGVEEKEEIQTDRTYATEMSDFEEDVGHNVNLSNCADAMIIRHPGKSVSVPAPDVSLQGFCRMLKAVEDDVSLGRSPKFYFRSATPRPSVIQEIITNANRGSPLAHLNVESIAMVILEQLPCLSMNSKNSCLLTDQILTSCYGEVNNKVVRNRLDPSDHLLWDSLYNHFLVFLQHKVLSVTDIAETFSPLLISGNSKLQKQAVVVMTKILEAVSEEELNIASPRSTSDFSLATPRPPKDGATVSRPAVQSVKSSTTAFDEKPRVLAAAKAPVPSSLSPLHHSTPLLPGLPLGNSLDEDGLPMSRDPQATLTQTAAYKQLLASTNLSNKLPDMDSDEDDEIEKNLSQHFSNPRPTTANKSSEENIKSPKSPEKLKSPKSPKSDSARSTFSDEMSLKQEIDRKNSLVLKSASLKSGRSAVENIISRVHDDFDLSDDDPPIPTSSLPKSNNVQLKVAKNDDDDDFWA